MWIWQWMSTVSWSSSHRDEKQISSGSCFLEACVYLSLELKIYNAGKVLTILMTGCLSKGLRFRTNFMSMLGGSTSQGWIYTNLKHRPAENLLSMFFPILTFLST